MRGARASWTLSLGLIVAGNLTAHVLAYRLVIPDAERREHVLEASGHGYLDPAPLASLCVTLVAVGFLARLLDGRFAARRTTSPWLFALAPPLAFTVQEHAERLIHDESFPHAAALEPTFLVGLLLQLPFALVAFGAARALLAGADALAGALTAAPRRPPSPQLALPVPAAADRPRGVRHALARGPRGPPSLRSR